MNNDCHTNGFQAKMDVLEKKLNQKDFMTINLSEGLKEQLNMISTMERQSRSELCRNALKELVKNYNKKSR